MELNNIPKTGNWNDVSSRINDNFSKVNNSITRLDNIEQNRKGYFADDVELKAAYPSPNVGWYAYVGSTGTIWSVNRGNWRDTQEPIPSDVDLSGYAHITDLELKANHGYDSNPKTLKEVDDSKVDKLEVEERLNKEISAGTVRSIKKNEFFSGSLQGAGTGAPMFYTRIAYSIFLPVVKGANIKFIYPTTISYAGVTYNVGVRVQGRKYCNFDTTTNWGLLHSGYNTSLDTLLINRDFNYISFGFEIFDLPSSIKAIDIISDGQFSIEYENTISLSPSIIDDYNYNINVKYNEINNDITENYALKTELVTKADHGYEINPKTLKEVDDNLAQLAGDIGDKITISEDGTVKKDGVGVDIFLKYASTLASLQFDSGKEPLINIQEKTITFFTTTIIRSGQNLAQLAEDKIVSIYPDSSLFSIFFDFKTGSFYTRSYVQLSIDSQDALICMGNYLGIEHQGITASFPYSIDGGMFTHDNPTLTTLNCETLPNVNSISKSITFYPNTYIPYGSEHIRITEEITTPLHGTKGSQVFLYFNIKNKEFYSTNDFSKRDLLICVAKNNAFHNGINCAFEYTMDGKSFYLKNRDADFGKFQDNLKLIETVDFIPNINSTTMELDLGGDPIILVNGNSYPLSIYHTDSSKYRKIKLEWEGSSAQMFLFNVDTKEFYFKGFNIKKSFNEILVGAIRTNNSDRLEGLSLPFRYKVDGVLVNGGSGNDGGDVVDKTNILYLNRGIEEKLIQLKRPMYTPGEGVASPILTILHFSDIHRHVANMDRIVEFSNHYNKYIDILLNTGDTVQIDGLESLDWYDTIYAKSNKPILNVIGNHDTSRTTQQVAYDKLFAPHIDEWGVVQPPNASTEALSYYYKDFSEYSVRLVALNVMALDVAQQTWFHDVLIDAKSKDLSVIVATHFTAGNLTYDKSNTFTSLIEVDDADMTDAVKNSVDSFIESGGKFICWLGGHLHRDRMGIDEGHSNQLWIGVENARQGDTVNDGARISGDKSQDCFNIIGFDTTAKIIKIVRVGKGFDSYLRRKNVICYDYSNNTIVFNG